MSFAALIFVGHDGLFAAQPQNSTAATNVRVAGIVLKWLPTNKQENFRRAEPLIRQAAEGGAQVVCTTECFLDGYAIDDKSIPIDTFRSLGEPIPQGSYYQRLCQLADELEIHLVAGMLQRDGDSLYNTVVMIGPDGRLIGTYHKQELGHEEGRVTAGHDSPVFDTSVGRIGTIICADRRDKQLVRRICEGGAELLICPSGGMFGPEKNDWIVQNRSRENGKYIVFVHPAEFLVTRPDGSIAHRTILGDRLAVDRSDVSTPRDSSGVFFFDVPLGDRLPDAAWIARQLQKPILAPQEPWNEFRTFVDAKIPRFNPPTNLPEWERQREVIRQQILDRVVFRGEAARWREAPLRVQWFGDIEGGPDYRVRKLAYEAAPHLWIPALLYEPMGISGKVPVVINVNGHDRGGKARAYKQRRCINLAKRGMLALNLEFLGMGQLRDDEDHGNEHNRLAQLDVCGTSGLAPFYLVLQRGLDVALAHDHADSDRVGVTGLSGGGWQTIWLAALDTRVTLANPVAGYCSLLARSSRRENIGDAEQIPADMCQVADYTHLTALVAPRPLLLTYNAKDNCCFLPPDVLPDLESAARPVYRLFGRETSFSTHVNQDPGTHNFERDNREALYRLIGKHFFPTDSHFDASEIAVADAEIRTADQLAVPLPSDNATLHSLAVELSRRLPQVPPWPNSLAAARTWQIEIRRRLRSVVRLPKYQATTTRVGKAELKGTVVSHLRLRMDDRWTVPAVEFRPPNEQSAVLLISDDGCRSMTGTVQSAVAAGQRVLAVDLVGFGEAGLHVKDGKNDDIALHLAATAGHCPLGILVAQLTAAAHQIHQEAPGLPLTVVSVGPRSSVIALVAAALDHSAIAGVETHHSWGSLQELIRRDMQLDEAPELFCFGLLKEVDIPHLIALVAPRSVAMPHADIHAQWDLVRLTDWYRLFGEEFDLGQ